MEDSSLDDFFAKKDKTKKKNKSKLTPSDILAQQDTGSTKKSKKKKDKENEAASEERRATNDDENWVDFEQETETDYTGLRIQNLQLANKEEGEEEEEVNENEDEEDGETKQKKEEMSGPWHGGHKSSQPQTTQPATPVPEPPPPQTEPPKDEESKQPRKYVPPGARGSTSISASGTPSRLTTRKKRTAPNLESEDDFPTLGGGGAPEVRSWGIASDSRGDFERVQSGGRNIDDPNKESQQLTLGNRYSSLQD